MHLNTKTDEIIFAGADSGDSIFSIIFAGSINSRKDHIIMLTENAYTFGYLSSGSAAIVSSGSEFNINEKEVFFVGEAASAASKLVLTSDSEGYYFSFTGKLPHSLVDVYSIPSVTVREADVSEQIEHLKKILKETDSNDYASAMRFASPVFFELMLQLAYADTSAFGGKDSKKTEAERIKSYIDNMIYNDPSLDDIKDHFGITKMHAIRTFKNHYNMTPMQYAIQKRTEIAANLLRTTDLPIKNISDMLHYSNTQHFSNSFKKILGLSPNRYRTQHGKI